MAPAMAESALAPSREGARAPGRIVARRVGPRTVVAEAHATSPLRLVQTPFPAENRAAAVCLVTFGGGLVDGDAIDVTVEVEEGATLLLYTQSTTKVFRGAASQSIRAKVAGRLALLPDPVAAFEGASYTQRVEIELSGSGSCLVLDGVTSGRAAYGERWAMRRLELRTTVRQDGRTLALDALVLDPADGPIGERAGRFEALSTLLAVGFPTAYLLEPPPPPTPDLAIAVSPLARAPGGDGAAVRIAATSPAMALEAARRRLRNLPDIELVDPFGARY